MSRKITFLGTGTSQGVPVICCDCAVCLSSNPKDQRLRTSALISYGGHNMVIDTGPDFRQQMLREKVKDISAVVFTHEHKDHVAGLDDIRPFNYIRKKDMDVYASEDVKRALHREYPYAFGENLYPGVPKINLIEIDLTPFEIEGQKWIPIEVMHKNLPVYGFRIDNLAYITDANYISNQELKKLEGVEILVINALRIETHYSHFNLEQAVNLSQELGVKEAYFTHVSHMMGLQEDIEKTLPNHIKLAFDGLQVEF